MRYRRSYALNGIQNVVTREGPEDPTNSRSPH